MKKIFLVFSVCIITIMILSFKSTRQFEPVAVIELFTSQGCSSCPSADRVLSQTIADAKKDGRKIFALSFHVDYWNRLGWTDPFSDRKYSDRQSDYVSAMRGSSEYTPQMIVNGSSQFVGSDKNKLNVELSNSLNKKCSATFKMLIATFGDGKAPHVQYALDGDFANCKINFALVSLSETTQIKRGENGGRTLTSENVVRQFISQQATGAGEIDFNSSPIPLKNNLAIIAYIQHTNDFKIIGAAMAAIK